ncbi:MAG: hypothetical protein BWY31_03415 [Lentisphaerae bacterium ADurb.Bin242]|nr:MAG: hypothetical protein BWY31_03415 [Lentisphaerae bacterium ADurb.Bin242]
MDLQKIKDTYFSPLLEADSETPLYLRIQRAIEAYIEANEHNAPFPSERELTQLLQVNRRTLHKAVEPFVKSKQLRRVKNDTFVNKSSGACGAPPVKPLLEAHPKTRLTLLCDENLPFQVTFWKTVTDSFNLLFPSVELQVKYFSHDSLPLDRGSLVHRYLEEFVRGGFDLIHLPVSYLWNMDITEVIASKSSLAKLVSSDEFICSELASTAPGLLLQAVPYAFNFQLYAWNERFMHLGGRDVRKLPFEETLRLAVKELTEDISILPLYYDLSRDLGVPLEFTPEIIREHCGIILDRIDLVKDRKNVFQCQDKMGVFFVGNSKKLLCSPNYSFCNKFYGGKMSLSLFETRERVQYWGGLLTLGINKDAPEEHYARLFLEYLLSGPVQDRIWELLNMAPVRVSSLSTMDFADTKELQRFLSCCRENPRRYLPPVGCTMLPYFEDYWNGKCSREAILKNTLRFYE